MEKQQLAYLANLINRQPILISFNDVDYYKTIGKIDEFGCITYNDYGRIKLCKLEDISRYKVIKDF